MISQGLQELVLCPGSRSAPLAIAAGCLAEQDAIRLHTAIDERSAAFLALGLATGSGSPTAVITTSGSAVANLLPAAVEADRSCQPLLLLTADRPQRLKNCGANQTVNQEDFLAPVCRWVGSGPLSGLDQLDSTALVDLAQAAWSWSLQTPSAAPGPVHLNLPFDEPLHPSLEDQEQVDVAGLQPTVERLIQSSGSTAVAEINEPGPCLDPTKPGVVVAGPWRGLATARPGFQTALQRWCQATGWPVLADPLAAVPSDCPGCVASWELVLDSWTPPEELHVLRLGPLPASRRLERWLQRLKGDQVLVSEGEPRSLDPLAKVKQSSAGLEHWIQQQTLDVGESIRQAAATAAAVPGRELESFLDRELSLEGPVTEPALARGLARLLPAERAVMLAASSPVRDWLTWSGSSPGSSRGSRPCFSFRGASGLDGTLSLAMGLSLAKGPLVLVCGDLALLHDSNGWLHATQHRPPLLVVLIDNAGGGIFQQLTLPVTPAKRFERLFAMPQAVNPLALAAAHGIPTRQISCLEDLDAALAWGLALSDNGPVLLRVCTDAGHDASLRQRLRISAQNALLSD